MTLSKSQKIWLGIGTFLPLIYLVFFFLMIFGIAFTAVSMTENGTDPEEMFGGSQEAISIAGAGFWILSIFLMSAISLAVLIIYIIHAVKNPEFDSSDRLLWILLFIFVGFIGEVIYFFLHIVKSPNKSGPQQVEAAHS